MRLASIREPFDHPDWLFELKYDGFRALAVMRGGACSLISRNRNAYKSFPDLCDELAALGMDAVLDGEIAAMDEDGRPMFYDLLRHRSQACFVAFDIAELAGRDLRRLPLMERKHILHRTVRSGGQILAPGHIEGGGVKLFREVCGRDLEGIVCKWKYGRYVTGEEQPVDRSLRRHAFNPESAARLTWLKVKNPAYSQAVGRDELFQKRAG